MSVSAKISSASKVYYGPSPTIYPAVGSVAINDNVTIYWKEDEWFYAQYDISPTQKKRGYIPVNCVLNYQSIIIPLKPLTGCLDNVKQYTTVYTGPSTTLYTTAGSISSKESVTVFNEVSDIFTYIEYSTSTGTKRGYIKTELLSQCQKGVLGKVSSSQASVYSGPNSNDYYKCGSAYLNEYVVIIEQGNSEGYPYVWYGVEYNTTSGRKRGYVSQSAIDPCSSVLGVTQLRITQSFTKSIQNLTVYYGPNQTYPSIGSINTADILNKFDSLPYESDYAFI